MEHLNAFRLGAAWVKSPDILRHFPRLKAATTSWGAC